MAELMEAVTSLAKRRGIAFQSSEIYGGLRSSWDYGPLGVELRPLLAQLVEVLVQIAALVLHLRHLVVERLQLDTNLLRHGVTP